MGRGMLPVVIMRGRWGCRGNCSLASRSKKQKRGYVRRLSLRRDGVLRPLRA